MEINDLADRLSHHEKRSEQRFEQLHHAIKEGKHMSETARVNNVFETPMGGWGGGYAGAGGAAGLGGAGGAAIGALLGSALGGNGGIFGGRHGGDFVTPMQLQTATASIVDSNQNTAIQQSLQGIATSIPVAEGNVQLALAQATGQLSNQINTNLVSNTQGFANTNQGIATATAGIIAVGESIKDTVNSTSAATQLAIANSVAQGLQNTNFIVTSVRDDGDKTRALIVAQNEAGLRNEITALQIRLQEQNGEARARGIEVNVSQNVNQQQAQLQTQAQLIQVGEALRNLAGDIQAVRQTQSQVVFGNNIGSGQAANATNNSVR